jgi:putative transposase
LIDLVKQHVDVLGIKGACNAFDIAESSYFRSIAPKKKIPATPSKKHHRALDIVSRAAVLSTLTSEKYQDKTPHVVVAMLLDEGKYLCSSSTMYRILEENKSVKERRDQLRHPNYTKPELIATGAMS